MYIIFHKLYRFHREKAMLKRNMLITDINWPFSINFRFLSYKFRYIACVFSHIKSLFGKTGRRSNLFNYNIKYIIIRNYIWNIFIKQKNKLRKKNYLHLYAHCLDTDASFLYFMPYVTYMFLKNIRLLPKKFYFYNSQILFLFIPFPLKHLLTWIFDRIFSLFFLFSRNLFFSMLLLK